MPRVNVWAACPLQQYQNTWTCLLKYDRRFKDNTLYQFFDLMVHKEDVIPAPEPGSHGLAMPGDPEIEDYRRNQVRDDKTTMHHQVKESVLYQFRMEPCRIRRLKSAATHLKVKDVAASFSLRYSTKDQADLV